MLACAFDVVSGSANSPGLATLGEGLDDAARVAHVPLFAIAPRPIYLLPLLRMGVMSQLVTRESADLGWADQFEAELWDLERLTGVREAERAQGGDDDLRTRLSELACWRGRGFHVVSYGRYGSRWKTALAQAGVRELNQPVPSGVVRPPRDKVLMREWFRDLGVATPASFVVEQVDYHDVAGRLGATFVAQRPRGNGGNGTYLISDEDAAQTLPRGGRWLLSEYVGDTTVNFHGFAPCAGAVEVLRPSLQLTDVEGSGSGFGQFCGSDFGAPAQLSPRALSRCRSAVRRIGTGLQDRGYRGVFGVDFAIRGDGAFALEVNYRMQGSTWLLGELELADGRFPTMLRHVAERGDLPLSGTATCASLDAVQLVVRHTGPSARLVRAPRTGVYRFGENHAEWRRPGFGLLECQPQEYVVANVPRVDITLRPGAIIARIVGRESLTSCGKNLTANGRRTLAALRDMYQFEQL